MKKIVSYFLSAFVALSSIFAQTSLDNDVYKKVSASVFEVVVEKHEDTKIIYEKELPLERIPFAIRNDKYMPIGTAFLLTDGSFYTAAHVVNLYGESVYDKYFVRDVNEKVYEIDKIQAFSERRDFIKFSAKGFKFSKGMGLETDDNFELNSDVFSVGNALGEGIVIRNGSLTSQTYEQKNGDWKWLRFSAAASPGNSGGPLIKPDGKVIGIITMKSENENLNYALPIKEINSEKAGTGSAFADYKYVLPNILSYKHPRKFEATITLPKTLAEVNKELTQLHKQNIIDCVNEMKKDYGITGAKCFDNSQEKDEFFMRTLGVTMPLLIYHNQSGVWDYARPNNIQTYNLEENGYVEYGSMVNYYFARIRPPDSVPLKELIINPKKCTDYLTKPFNLSRNVYGEQINILSLGEPEKSETYVDYFGRTWYVNYYALDFADALFMTFSLPLPTGVFLLGTISTRKSVTATNYIDAQFMTDFIYPRYGGKLKFWRQYFSLPSDIRNKFSVTEKQMSMKESKDSLSLSIGDITLSVSKKDINYNDESAITVRTGYDKIDGKVVIKNRNLVFTTSTTEADFKSVSILQVKNPGANAKETLIQSWNQLVNQVSPYNNEPYCQESYTYLDKIVYPAGFDKDKLEYLYILTFAIEGQNKFDEIKKFAENIEKGITLK
ncbi:MAG: trypsin-like peptidase domain-containing protein [Treponema sp.]|uniref:S1 family peptidase n=1 Tax=Treponema sp. TaxID=166 RepID=UPI0025DDBE47|nr:trypsin-like peptidase domain-containing protein [Treponema sp.]MBQ8678443.1 trypsin-like peptidase domain-containing protein [Treponema sp.]